MGVLDDHRREGKLFKPPMSDIGALSEVSWVNDMLPEFLWIALLHDKHGLHQGVDLAYQLASAAIDVETADNHTWFAPMTSFKTLDQDQRAGLISALNDRNILESVIQALHSLLDSYPACPMAFLRVQADDNQVTHSGLDELRALISRLFDKWARPATLVQATAVYLALATGRLKIMEGITWIDDFEQISEYPSTETSRMVGASVRATCLSLFPMLMQDVPMEWPGQFWNRGLELADCK